MYVYIHEEKKIVEKQEKVIFQEAHSSIPLATFESCSFLSSSYNAYAQLIFFRSHKIS